MAKLIKINIDILNADVDIIITIAMYLSATFIFYSQVYGFYIFLPLR